MRAILSEHAEEQIVATDASVRLAQLSRAMPTGNLGVSGARGAGKTTLLRNFCDATLEWRDTSQGTGRSRSSKPATLTSKRQAACCATGWRVCLVH